MQRSNPISVVLVTTVETGPTTDRHPWSRSAAGPALSTGPARRGLPLDIWITELLPSLKASFCPSRFPSVVYAPTRRSHFKDPEGTLIGVVAVRWRSTWRHEMRHRARVELVLDCTEPQRLAPFWREALDYRDFYTDPNLAVLVPRDGTAPPLLLQGVPEPKAVKNRVHFDIVVDDIEAEVHRLQELGARRVDEGVQSFGGTRWVRMSDPEQNEFCVSTGIEW
jgi:predicted enzyme related to lactoylglutathione lyase